MNIVPSKIEGLPLNDGNSISMHLMIMNKGFSNSKEEFIFGLSSNIFTIDSIYDCADKAALPTSD